MKPFSLEEYLANPSRKLVTRDGRPARIICTDKLDKRGHPICALNNYDGEEIFRSYTTGGKFLEEQNDESDLFFAPEKKEGWINIYKTDPNNYELNNYGTGTIIYNSKEEATAVIVCRKDYVATIKIEWEE